jgi:hypothetical protein
MCRDEIDRQPFLCAIVKKLLDPHSSPFDLPKIFQLMGDRLVALLLLSIEAIIGNEVTRGGTSDSELSIDPFQRQRRRAIKLKKLGPCRITE